jgi:hypothetical protein
MRFLIAMNNDKTTLKELRRNFYAAAATLAVVMPGAAIIHLVVLIATMADSKG